METNMSSTNKRRRIKGPPHPPSTACVGAGSRAVNNQLEVENDDTAVQPSPNVDVIDGDPFSFQVCNEIDPQLLIFDSVGPPQQQDLDRSMLPPPPIRQLLDERRWEEVTVRALSCPDEIQSAPDPSPLAVACRSGAPLACIQALLSAAPNRLRKVLDSRGTPLHEAIVCDATGPDVIQILLETDEMLGKDDEDRATLLQDVDGFTPLHLLIRRRFQTHILMPDDADTGLMSILEMMVRSCPDAVIIPDRGEYKEAPIVYALKANIYAPSLGSEDDTLARIERQIFEMVACMLRYCPVAASRIFTGYRGQYTALHSAVFHGRHTRTIELILQTEAARPAQHQKAALLANTQGEMPLHFCAMRGERPRSVALIANAAPEAVMKRDASGLTPFHWLWIRFVSTLFALDEGGRDRDAAISDAGASVPRTDNEDPAAEMPSASFLANAPNQYSAFTTVLEPDDFDMDLQLIRRLDPPVDFLSMRHIPLEVLGDAECMAWAHRSVQVLQRIRTRYLIQHQEPTGPSWGLAFPEDPSRPSLQGPEENLNIPHVEPAADESRGADGNVDEDNDEDSVEGLHAVIRTRQEAVMSFFWTKVVSLLQASREAIRDHPVGDSILVHTAFANPSCLASVTYVVASLFPEELTKPDQRGRLPVHYAACRPWHSWDWPREDGTNEPNAAKLLQQESLSVLNVALNVSPLETIKTADGVGRLVLHHVISTFVRACSRPARSVRDSPLKCMLQMLGDLIRLYPESLHIQDGVLQLVPFLQASAVATEEHIPCYTRDELPLTMTYTLLREDPAILSSLVRPSSFVC